MSTLDERKLITEKFLENAINEQNDVAQDFKNESEKLILDEISSEKTSEEPQSPVGDNDNEPNDCTLKPTEEKEDVCTLKPVEEIKEDIDNLSEETESTRDLKSSEREVSYGEKEIEQNENSRNAEEPKEEWQDILGSGVIMKKILKEGEPDTRPNRSNICIINYTCRLEDADENDFTEKAEHFELGLGEGDVVQGLDVSIGLMNKKERCLLKIGARLAFGERGLAPKIPGNATVMFDVELVDVKFEDEIESLSVQGRRNMGNKKRERGNWWYQRGDLTLAIQCYRRALDYLDEVCVLSDKVKTMSTSFLTTLNNIKEDLNVIKSGRVETNTVGPDGAVSAGAATDVLHEVSERQRRSNNLMIFNLPEGDGEPDLTKVESENTEHAKPSDAELQELLEDRLKVLNNMASAQIKMELYDQALTSLQTVLRCQPHNVKALFRKAKIHSAKNDLPQALKLLEKAKVLEPEDNLISREISTVNALISKQKNSEREYARRMFGGTSPAASTSKTKVDNDGKKSSGNKVQVWATIAATAAIGVAGVLAYKFKYT